MALQCDHRKAGMRRLAALVLLVDPGARQRLRFVLDGEDPEADGQIVRKRQLLQAARALLADVIVMRGLTSDHAAERDEAIESPALHAPPARHHSKFDRRGDLEGAGNRDALVAGARLLELG